MALKDFFTRTTPSPLPPEQLTLSAEVTPAKFKRPRKKKPELLKQIDRIPPENEDARQRLERLVKWKTRADRAEASCRPRRSTAPTSRNSGYPEPG